MTKTTIVFRSKLKVLSSAVLFLLSLSMSGQRDSNEQVLMRIDSLLNRSAFTSAQQVALDYLKKRNLSDDERFQFWMIRAGIIRASSQPSKAIVAYEKAESYIPDSDHRELYLSQIQMRLAECYFDIPEYELAAHHATQSLNISPDTSMANTGHVNNYLILGYVEFLKENYASSLEYYRAALVYYREHEHQCDLPLVYTKMAKVANALGNSEEAFEYIDKCKVINDSCGVKPYTVLIFRTLYEIHLVNEEYEEALDAYRTLGDLNSEIEYARQATEMADMEREHESDLKRTEIAGLKLVNNQNEIIKRQQYRFLAIALISIVGLTTLSILLARANRRRAKAMQSLGKLNQNLEFEVAQRTSHLHAANESIQRQAGSIAERNSSLTELNHMVSHNLRGPINNLTMLANLLEDAKDEDERNQLMLHMRPVLDSLHTTADELLEKVDCTTQNGTDRKRVNFAHSLESAKRGLLVELEKSGATISTDFSKADSVFYSQKHLSSIFYNFLSNSLKYAHPERSPQLHISTSQNEHFILLRFKDNGCGIDLKKNGRKLFKFKEVFHDHPDSKGIGLYMLKIQIERAGGEIWAESQPNAGSDFFVKFVLD